MGKFQGTGYINPLSAKLTDRYHKAPSAAKVSAAAPQPTPKVERALIKRALEATPTGPSDSRVTHEKKDATAAVRRARWRKKNPEQHRDQQRAARARRKTGKLVA